jgi:hypothetical protein
MSGETSTVPLNGTPIEQYTVNQDLIPELAPAEATQVEINNPELKIDSEFENLLPSLTRDEYVALEDSLKQQGCHDRLTIWKGHNIILDGHNRYEICKKNNIQFDTNEIEIPDRTAARIWMIENQVQRRSLNESQRAHAGSRLRKLDATQAKERRGTRTDLGLNLDQSKTGRSAEKAAKIMGISHQTVSYAKRVAAKGVPELVDMVKRGDIKVSPAAKVADLPESEQEAIVKGGPKSIRNACKVPQTHIKQLQERCLDNKIRAENGPHRETRGSPTGDRQANL